MQQPFTVLVTGGSGYVGGRLIPLLEQKGLRVRCLARRPEFLKARVSPTTEIFRGDVLQAETLLPALEGVQVAYYLVHSMGTAADFEEDDRQAALNFAAAARSAGVRRIIYLGGLGDESTNLSKHLRSRQEVGECLRTSGALVIEFRASIVIGSGSLSFELIRALVQKLPVMLCPRWVSTQAQPIAIEDLLSYLTLALDCPLEGSQVFEIGGPDRMSYGQIMQEYARQRGLRRWMIPVPFLSPRLSSLWLGLVTPVYARVGRKLIDSLQNATVVNDRRALMQFDCKPRGVREAIERALKNEDQELAATRWSDALSASGPLPPWGGTRFGTRLVDSRSLDAPIPPSNAFYPIQRIGGHTGWYFANFLWRIRGWMDLLVGGVGMRRGRRELDELRVGDTLDCWRVEAFEPERRLRLFAEMRLPGRAWLEFEVKPTAAGCQVRQTAEFDPVGLFGLAYWYGIYPLHEIVFAGMLREIVRQGMNSARVQMHSPSVTKQALWLVGLLLATWSAAALGGWATGSSVGSWYQELSKPQWHPPDWIFGPVWSALYCMMAVAAWLVWRRVGWLDARWPMFLYAAQLALNALWSVLFFGLRSPGLAMAEILLLWVAIAITTIQFASRSAWAGWLMVPYLLWTTFAAILNGTLWSMN
ncbi:MAG: DUF2867 domain-containing protein [Pirellulaceae bacterium]|nr:DUF2867 domain-containing protein [Pirellulaceae bacterium]